MNTKPNILTACLPSRGYHLRILTYLNEMYPPLIRLVTASVTCLSFVAFLDRIIGVRSALLSPVTIVGVWTVFALALILRLMDELKDRDIDGELFSHRPLPSGRVRESDIKFSLLVVCAGLVIPNMLSPTLLAAALGVLLYAILMYHYFFVPVAWRKYLLLNLATHNPVVPVMLLYIVVLYAIRTDIGLSALPWTSIALLIAMYWSLFMGWEIARKIRHRTEETEYVTYSKIFGRTPAVIIALAVQSTAVIIGLHFYVACSLSQVFLAVTVKGGLTLAGGYVLFLAGRISSGTKLRLFAEAYAITIMLAVTIELILLPVVKHVFAK